MKSLTTLFFIFSLGIVNGQSVLTLSECYALAQAHYPLIRQSALIDETTDFSVENALKGNLPLISVGGQATYQSDVTQIPVEMPGVEPLSKYQYKIFGEAAQTLYGGGTVAVQKRSVEINGAVDKKRLDVDLYQLRLRINDLFFGILLLQEQSMLSALIKRDLAAGLKQTEAAFTAGTGLRSAADALRAELLKIDQRIIETESAEAAYRAVLGAFIDRPIDQAVLVKPEFSTPAAEINRPELSLFDLQARSIESNLDLLAAQKRPRVQLFVQGGYGRPGLNMLENEFDFYYIGGIRFSWQLSGYYAFRREKEILSLRKQSLDVQKETFLFNTRLSVRQHEAEVNRLRRLIAVDDQIIALRSGIRETAAVQLEEGVITSADFVREVNAEDQAKQNRALHETQLLMALAKYHFTLGDRTNNP